VVDLVPHGQLPEANHQLARGAQALERKDYQHALKHFNRALEIDPEFAEAYNQRRWRRTCSSATRIRSRTADGRSQRMPSHFGALAGMGHCYAHLGQFREAIDSYRQALAIHPHMDACAKRSRNLRPSYATKRTATRRPLRGRTSVAMTTHTSHLDRFIRAVHRRWILVRAAEHVGVCLAAGCVLSLLFLPILFWRGESALPVVVIMMLLGAGRRARRGGRSTAGPDVRGGGSGSATRSRGPAVDRTGHARARVV
jgi:tetratricopeptide (TPR) repeat protein